MKIFILLFLALIGLANSFPDNFDMPNDILSNFIIPNVFGQSNTSTITQYVSYENQKSGFSLEYPSYWTYKETSSYVSDNAELVNFMATSDTHISISRYVNNEFTNLSDQQYLDKMFKKYENECSNSKFEITCSDFQSLMSTTDSSGKYPSYVIGYTYSEKSASNVVADKSKLIIQIPDHDYIWKISVLSTSADLPNHLEEIASTLNSFTILPEPKDVGVKVESKPLSPQTTDSSKKGGGCLIATATYGSELAPQVQQLREIRDDHLLRTASGSVFMTGFNQLYYSFSPTVADWERENPAFKELVKITLTPMLSSLSLLNYVTINSESDVLGYGFSLILLNIGMYFVAPGVIIYKIFSRKFPHKSEEN